MIVLLTFVITMVIIIIPMIIVSVIITIVIATIEFITEVLSLHPLMPVRHILLFIYCDLQP